MFYHQRVQPEELERIKKHYETSEEEEVKLLDKPEQSVSPLLTGFCAKQLFTCTLVCRISRELHSVVMISPVSVDVVMLQVPL